MVGSLPQGGDMKGLWAIILIFCGLMSAALCGYNYDVKALRKWQPEFKRYHYWIGFSDFHDKTHQANNNATKKNRRTYYRIYDPYKYSWYW